MCIRDRFVAVLNHMLKFGTVVCFCRLRSCLLYTSEKKAGAVLRQAGTVFDDEALLCAAEEYGFEEPRVLDFAAGKKYRWTTGERKRIAVFDAGEYLRETEDDR